MNDYSFIAPPLRDSAGISPDFADENALRLFAAALATVAGPRFDDVEELFGRAPQLASKRGDTYKGHRLWLIVLKSAWTRTWTSVAQ
jgi:hypothetical protein